MSLFKSLQHFSEKKLLQKFIRNELSLKRCMTRGKCPFSLIKLYKILLVKYVHSYFDRDFLLCQEISCVPT